MPQTDWPDTFQCRFRPTRPWKDDSFKESIGTIYQSLGGEDVYPSLEEKAAPLLSLNHSFSNDNKHIATTLFLYFLEKRIPLQWLRQQKNSRSYAGSTYNHDSWISHRKGRNDDKYRYELYIIWNDQPNHKTTYYISNKKRKSTFFILKNKYLHRIQVQTTPTFAENQQIKLKLCAWCCRWYCIYNNKNYSIQIDSNNPIKRYALSTIVEII